MKIVEPNLVIKISRDGKEQQLSYERNVVYSFWQFSLNSFAYKYALSSNIAGLSSYINILRENEWLESTFMVLKNCHRRANFCLILSVWQWNTPSCFRLLGSTCFSEMSVWNGSEPCWPENKCFHDQLVFFERSKARGFFGQGNIESDFKSLAWKWTLLS